jgi:hypothetical protein
VIESAFATVRLRERATKGAGSRTKGLLMAFKLLDMAQQRWRPTGERLSVANDEVGVTVPPIRSNPPIRTFYLRLRARGKHAKPALTTCMRKLLVILNAMLRNKTHWQTPVLATSTSTIYPLRARYLNTVAAGTSNNRGFRLSPILKQAPVRFG